MYVQARYVRKSTSLPISFLGLPLNVCVGMVVVFPEAVKVLSYIITPTSRMVSWFPVYIILRQTNMETVVSLTQRRPR